MSEESALQLEALTSLADVVKDMREIQKLHQEQIHGLIDNSLTNTLAHEAFRHLHELDRKELEKHRDKILQINAGQHMLMDTLNECSVVFKRIDDDGKANRMEIDQLAGRVKDLEDKLNAHTEGEGGEL